MATVNYTSLLGLALPTTGDLSGQWGNEVNNFITQYVDSAVAGTQTISADTNTTLTVTNGSALGSTSAQYLILNCTGARTAARTVTLPASSRHYVVINSTTGGFAVNIVGAGPTTGISVANGERCVIAWDGSDYVKIATSVADGVTTFSAGTTGFTPSTATSGAVTLAGTLATTNGGTGLTSFTSGGAVYATSTSALTTGTLPTTAGGTGLTSFTANRVFYASSTSAIAQSANLTFDGTTLTAANFTDSSLTSGRVTYATTGGNLTDSANLTFDGSNLGVGATTVAARVDIVGSTDNQFRLSSNETNATTKEGKFLLRHYTNAQPNFLVMYPYSTSTDNAIFYGGGSSSQTAATFHAWSTAANNTTVSGTERMRLDSSGNLGLGTTNPSLASGMGIAVYNSTVGGAARIALKNGSTGDAAGDGFQLVASGVDAYIEQRENGFLAFTTNNTERMQITAAGFTRPVAYADTVSALGNTGTATTINLQNANVFTATLTGNCTFTLSNPIATGSSSFTLILTNDATAGRTVAWAGGSFKFPGGAASLSRTTTANAVDVWVFFTPDGGTTYYGSIPMKNMTA